MGSAAGLALGNVALQFLMAVSSAPAWLDPTPNWRVFLFAIVIGLATALASARPATLFAPKTCYKWV
jgi:hypothetical protein